MMVLRVVVVFSVAKLMLLDSCFFFFKQKTAYEMRISDWSSDVCSSDLFLQAGKEFHHVRCAVLVADVLDLRAEAGRVGDHVVFQIDREIDKTAGHASS